MARVVTNIMCIWVVRICKNNFIKIILTGVNLIGKYFCTFAFGSVLSCGWFSSGMYYTTHYIQCSSVITYIVCRRKKQSVFRQAWTKKKSWIKIGSCCSCMSFLIFLFFPEVMLAVTVQRLDIFILLVVQLDNKPLQYL